MTREMAPWAKAPALQTQRLELDAQNPLKKPDAVVGCMWNPSTAIARWEAELGVWGQPSLQDS